MPDYRAIAKDSALSAGIDPEIFERQIKQESDFNPNALNPTSGATGIAQIVPRFHPNVDATDPIASLKYAANWMKMLIVANAGLHPSAYARALASYNWGPGNVSKWNGQRATLPGETRQYLDVILGEGWEQAGTAFQTEPAAAGGMSRAAGETHRVTGVGSIGLKVRQAPGLSGLQIGSLQEGDLVQLGVGVRQQDGFVWCQLISPIAGWAAAIYLNPMGPITQPAPRRVGVHYVFPVQGYTGLVNLHWGVFEGGSDIFAAQGTPVVAMCNGLVDGAGFGSVSGNYVSMIGDDGLDYWYAHGDASASVSKGQHVAAGDFLMPLGDSGNAKGKGMHLHIGIGHGISEGADATGGCGKNFNAVDLLRRVLQGQA